MLPPPPLLLLLIVPLDVNPRRPRAHPQSSVMPMPPAPRSHQQSSVDELVFNNDMDHSHFRRPATKFDPSYSTMAVRRLSQHPFRGLPAFMTDEPSYPMSRAAPRTVADHMQLSRIQMNQHVVGNDGPDLHAFVTGKIGKAPHPAHFTALALSSSSRLPRGVPPPNEMALARASLPDARYGPMGSTQPGSARGNPFGPLAGQMSNRYFGRLGNVRTQLA